MDTNTTPSTPSTPSTPPIPISLDEKQAQMMQSYQIMVDMIQKDKETQVGGATKTTTFPKGFETIDIDTFDTSPP